MISNDNKRFLKRVFALMIPVLIQNGITNFVNMLDNLMVGNVGTAEMTGVSVASMLIFIFNLCIFGAVSGAGIFGAQFFGAGDVEGQRQTFRFKIILCVIITGLAVGAIVLFGDGFTWGYLSGEGDALTAHMAFVHAHDYLYIMLVSLLPFALVQCWSSTLRESGRTVLPMAAGFAAMAVNLVLNYILIFGHLGAPAMGVRGAAIATVVSRFVELFIVAIGTWMTRAKGEFIIGVFRHFRVSKSLMKKIFVKALPLMLNETLWAAGLATLNRFYSTRGLDVVAANNINITFFNVFSVSFFSIGIAVGIILGQTLGAGEIDEARKMSGKLMVLSLVVSSGVAVIYGAISPFVPMLYNTNDSVRSTATGLMIICAVSIPFESLMHTAYFTIRSGGHSLLTVIFDSGFMWAVSVPVVILFSELTDLSVYWLYGAVQVTNVIKCVIGIILVRRGRWATNIVKQA